MDLLQAPGDPLSVAALLPENPVAVGESWKPADWAARMLTSLEAVQKSDLKCTFESLKEGIATIRFTAEIHGAVYGAVTVLKLKGLFQFDVGAGFVRRLDLEQSEERSVGAVSPGLEVTAHVTFDPGGDNNSDTTR